MNKLLQWLAKLMIGTILVSGITLYVTWLTIHTYVDKLLASYNIEVPDTGIADLFGMGGGKKAGGSDRQEAGEPSEAGDAGAGTGARTGVGAGIGADSGNSDAAGSSDNESDREGTAGSGQSDGDKKDRVQTLGSEEAGGSDAALAMSSKELIDLKEKMSEADKAEMMKLLMKIPESRMQELSALLEGGLTEAELQEMKEQTQAELSAEEYDQLLHILNKYE